MQKQRVKTSKETIRFSVTMFPDMKTRLDRMSKKKNISLSALINAAINEFLQRYK